MSSSAASAPGPGLSTHYRWLIAAMLFLATTINYIDRQILAIIKPILDEEMHWTNEQYGLTLTLFQGAYAVSLLFFGWVVDRYGAKLGYQISIAAWSVAAMAHALVSSVAGFCVARVALGLGEGGNYPAAIKAVTLWFPKRERATATAIVNAGANVGAFAAPLIVPLVALSLGWHWAFVFAGLAGLVWFGVWHFAFDLPGKIKSTNAAELALIRSDPVEAADEGAKMSWLSLLRYRQTWSFILAKSLTDPVWWFFLIWLPDFFKKTRHLDIKNSGYMLATIYGLATVLSIFGSWMTGALLRAGWSITRARKTSMFVTALCVLPVMGVKNVGDWPAVVILGLAAAAHQAFSANLFTTVSDMFPKRAVASIVGLGGMAGSVVGMIFPVLAGRLLDVFTAKGNVTAGYAILFTICGGAYVAAFVLQHLFAPKFEMVEIRPAASAAAG